MKKFLTSCFFFFVIFFIVEKSTYYFLYKASEKEYDKRLEYLITGKLNKDLIIIGSSRGASNVMAGQIEKETGLSSYNLSYPGSNVIFHEFILKTLVKFNDKPKKVILVVDNPYEFVRTETLNFRFDRLHPLAQYNYINDGLISQKENNILSNYFCLARLSRSSFKLDNKEIPSKNPIDSFGSMPYIGDSKVAKTKYLKEVKNYSKSKELESYLKAFNNIQEICEYNNVELIFVFSPNYQKFNDSFKNRFETLLLPNNKIMVYDTLNTSYENKDYYYDVSHLLKNGATIFTSEIITFINDN